MTGRPGGTAGSIRGKVLRHPSPPDGCTRGTLSQLYGGYLVPGSTLRNLHLVVSHWNTTDGSNWPYRAMQYRHNAGARR
jgi:hypothetical protein